MTVRREFASRLVCLAIFQFLPSAHDPGIGVSVETKMPKVLPIPVAHPLAVTASSHYHFDYLMFPKGAHVS
jgi:hypothetical protein